MFTELKHSARFAKKRLSERLPSYQYGDLDNLPESILISGAAIVAGVGVRHGLMAAWKKWRGGDPPINPTAPEVSWSDALIWAAAVGTTVGVARVLARRGSTALARRYYEASR